MTHLAPFPVDDETLDLIEAALESGGLCEVLAMLSGYDESQAISPMNGEMDEYGGYIYHWRDVILALIGEVRRQRSDRRRFWRRRRR